MRSRSEVLSLILQHRVIAVVRMTDAQKLKDILAAISDGGVKCLEITMTVPNAVKLIEKTSRSAAPDVLIGAGTVTDPETADAVISAGASFVVGPVFNPHVLKAAHDRNVLVMPGCFSPTEIHTAWKFGADIIKLFPATSLGPKFIKDIHGPLPDVRIIPTGGVSVENAAEWIKAGACAVGIGTDLLDKKMIEAGDYVGLRERARTLVNNIKAVS
jgi:2-dehydro-3-deoxyphosphogluconate aldolase/(4S)-4-hydroxy-2-oxoglutarate aldolase